MQPTPDRTLLTPEGYSALSDELAALTSDGRSDVAEELRRARAISGDPGDNAEVLEARREQQRLEQRIATLEARLRTAEVVEGTRRHGVAGLGSEVRVEDVETGSRTAYRLVGSVEAAPAEGRISIESPVGRALLGHRKGELVEVEAPRRRRRLRIVGVGLGRRRRGGRRRA
jgi:transcription elongation factor GreA